MIPVTVEELHSIWSKDNPDVDSDEDHEDKYQVFAQMATTALRILDAFDAVIQQQGVEHLFENSMWLNSNTLKDKSRLRLDVCREIIHAYRIGILFRINHRYLQGVVINRDDETFWYGSNIAVDIRDFSDEQLLEFVHKFVLDRLPASR